MTTKKKINVFRKKIMQGLTKNIGKSKAGLKADKDVKINRILISRPNHRLGNLLLLTPLVQEVANTFPDSKIDLFVKGGVTPIIYKNYENIDRIIQLPKKPFSSLGKYIKGWFQLKFRRYDLAINANHGSSSGRLSILFTNSKFKFFGESDETLASKYSDYNHDAKKNIYNLRSYLKEIGLAENTSKLPTLKLQLDPEEIKNGKANLDKIIQNDKKTICLFTNATGAKCYSEEWWNAFYDKLKATFPDYNIIELLPVENISKLNFKIPNFYSTDIREMGGFLANTAVFIAADNGVMHLSSAVNTPTVGLFSVTDETAYKPYNDKSFSINTNETDLDQMMELIKTTLI
ncbi:glycosyltransferase family 9 protein [Epilithonimonas ginsengisoli]|uniref:Glycosyltransferase family 9 protein n=1 Tax=Epilithonimonas ginsengisoli TaxID=1245592 RepID=A0ABU4JE62_9FLAO|nr:MULTISPECIES: glycosyltransferase family 9 protein [Chryseobacterium group]MBV6879334.1 glycosyltransferase family 9 protein [Epilithonimonas sp. FP105]MDW8547969.1 glycosyltransferase family 9 protein [Epilithonimonas ginsengisoli]OAH73109.1 ADP-heptose--LPS heptosyltransferase [Chryseobacterium sp. FP211-J200]